MIYQDKQTGSSMLATANIGDARILLVRQPAGGKAVAEQLSVDHVPDEVSERKRIENFNPNPKMPLVRFVAGTWRVGGLLALSRAFGDAYMKGSLQVTKSYSSEYYPIAV
jgi:protein phosphatase 1L